MVRLSAFLAGGGVLAVAAGVAAYVAVPKPGAVIEGHSGQNPGVAVEKSGPGAGLPVLARGRIAPEFSLPRLGGGGPVSLSSLRGHPVVLNFFASWCSDCRAELKAFAKVSGSQNGSVRFLAVDTNDSDPAKAISLLRAAGDRYPVGRDPGGAVASGDYLVEALPVTVFVSASGRVEGEAFGAQTVASLRSWVRALQGAPGDVHVAAAPERPAGKAPQ